MTSKPCWYCRGLPKFWWWLATLIGLPLLFFFMISDRQGPVESDLDDRVRKELISKDAAWAEVNLDDRGRDVMLSGKAPDEASRELAITTAENVYGVRTVDHTIEVVPFTSPELSIKTDASGMITLNGLLPSQEYVDSTAAAAGEAFGADKVNNQLGVGERMKESPWLGKVGAMLPALAGWKLATLDINDDGSKISGVARSDEAKGNLLQQAKELIGGKLEDGIEVKPLQAANLTAEVADGKMTLSGLLPTQQSADSLVSIAAKKMGADNISNEITVSDDAATAPWMTQARNLLDTMPPAITGANIADGTLTLEGTANSYQAHINALGVANAAIAGSDLNVQDNIKVEIPAQPEAKYAVYTPPPPAGQLQGSFADGKLTLSGSLASQAEVDAAVSAANTRVGADNVINQLTVNAEHSAASWLGNANKLLMNLPAMQGAMSISDSGAVFSGTTETNDDYMRALRQARSAMQGQEGMVFENNVVLDTSRLDQLAQEQAEQERLAREKAEQERLARVKAEEERLAQEKAEREELERLAREKAEREEQERLAKEQAEREEQERLAREAARISGQLAGTIADGKLTLAGTLQSQQEVDAVVAAANARIGADNVVNRLTIDAERRPANWLENAGNLLRNLPEMKGSMVINNDKAMFRGTVETNNDYITAIRQARAAMQGQGMAFENNVTLDTSRLDELARLAAEKAAREQAEREERERLAREQAEREKQERLAREKAEREEQERLAREQAEREEQERLARAKAEREEQERLAREQAEREEQERLAREAARPSSEVISSISDDGKLTLTGTMNSQQEVDDVVYAAETRVGADNVINQLNVDAEHKPAVWLDSAKKLILSLPTLDGIMFMNNERASFSGTEETKEDYIGSIRKARWSMQDQDMAFENKVKLDTSRLDELARLEREAARPSGAVAGIMSKNGKLTLTGTLNSQQEVDGMVYAAETRAGADNVINQLNVDAEHKPAAWLDSAKKLVLSLPKLKGIMSMNNDRATFRGAEETKEDYISTIRKARWSMQNQSAMDFENNVTLDTSRLDELARLAYEAARPSSEVNGVMSTDEKLTLSGTLNSEQEVGAIIDAANIRVGEDNIINQLNVDAEHKPAVWLDNAKKLLISLPPLEGKMSINNERATFSGKTETREDYMGAIRQGRWSMQSQADMAFENNVTLDTSRLDELARLAAEKAEQEKQARLAQEKLARQQSCQADLNQMTDSQTILFATNKAEIKTESYDLLFELASILTACEDDLAGKVVTIGGHTDSVGQAAYNVDLSQRRAGAVQEYLQKGGISSDLLEAVGYGEDRPVADNGTAEGRARNRRITFEIRGN